MNKDSLLKAITSLERALAQPKDEFIRDAAILRFKCAYELSWKMLQKRLTMEETDLKRLFSEAKKHNLIDDDKAWLNYLTVINLGEEAYQDLIAEEMLQSAQTFVKDAKKLLNRIN